MEIFDPVEITRVLTLLWNKVKYHPWRSVSIMIVDPRYPYFRQLCYKRRFCEERHAAIGNFIKNNVNNDYPYEDGNNRTSRFLVYLACEPIVHSFICIDKSCHQIFFDPASTEPIPRSILITKLDQSMQNYMNSLVKKEDVVRHMTRYVAQMFLPPYPYDKKSYKQLGEKDFEYYQRVFTAEHNQQFSTLAAVFFAGIDGVTIILDPCRDTSEKFAEEYKIFSENYDVKIEISAGWKEIIFYKDDNDSNDDSD